MEKANKQQLSDLELENITGGGVAAYAIKGGCTFAGMTLGIFAYCNIVGYNSIDQTTLKSAAEGAGYNASWLAGGYIGWKIGEEICKKFNIK